MMRFRAFTLSEVLITIGIVGLIAVLVVPMLVDNYKDRILESQKTKTSHTYTQAFKLMMARDETTDLSNTSIAACNGNKNCYVKELENVLEIADSIEKSSSDAQIKYKFQNGNFEVWSSNDILYVFGLGDGTINALEKTKDMKDSFIVDVNGFKSPNTGARDLCRFEILSSGEVSESCGSMAKFEESALPEKGSNACLVYNSSTRKCTKCSAGSYLNNGRCSNCSKGTYSENGATSCKKCSAGYYSNIITTKKCGKCQAGTYSARGAASCTNCRIGTYSAKAGATSCTTCPRGTSSTVGATKCTK